MFKSNKLTEKLRPQSLDKVILLPRIRNIVSNNKLSINYIFHGKHGLGKTSLAKILSKDYDTLYCNISNETSVDVLREKIISFLSTVSKNALFDNDNEKPQFSQTKVVILDEIDGASDQFFKALKATVEQFSHHVFIATTNFINKIPPEILSRFVSISFDPQDHEEEAFLFKEYEDRIRAILSALKIDITDGAMKELLRTKFPDMRAILNLIQNFVNAGVQHVDESTLKKNQTQFNDIFELLLNSSSPVENYKKLHGEYREKYREVLSSIANEYPDFLLHKNKKLYDAVLPLIIIKVADWQSKIPFLIDPYLAMLACFYDIQMVQQQALLELK